MAVLQPHFAVFPLSSDFKIPIPAYEEREEFTSPVPTPYPFSSLLRYHLYFV
jgi:hypothetical protein